MASIRPIKVRKTTLKSATGRIIYQVYVEGIRALGTIEHQPKPVSGEGVDGPRRGPWVFILDPIVPPAWIGYGCHRRAIRDWTRKELEMRITARSYGEREPMQVYAKWQNDDQGRGVLGLLAIRNGVPAYPGSAYGTIGEWLEDHDGEYGVEYRFSEGAFYRLRGGLAFELERALKDMAAAGVIPKWWTYAGIWGASA